MMTWNQDVLASLEPHVKKAIALCKYDCHGSPIRKIEYRNRAEQRERNPDWGLHGSVWMDQQRGCGMWGTESHFNGELDRVLILELGIWDTQHLSRGSLSERYSNESYYAFTAEQIAFIERRALKKQKAIQAAYEALPRVWKLFTERQRIVLSGMFDSPPERVGSMSKDEASTELAKIWKTFCPEHQWILRVHWWGWNPVTFYRQDSLSEWLNKGLRIGPPPAHLRKLKPLASYHGLGHPKVEAF